MLNVVVGLVKGIVCVGVVAVVVDFAVVEDVQVVVDVPDVAVFRVVPLVVLGLLCVSWECTFELYLFVILKRKRDNTAPCCLLKEFSK